MAGVTNAPFRTLCREYGAGLYVSEMVMSRGIVEHIPKTMAMIEFDPAEKPRSLQIYGVDPATVGAAVRVLVAEDRADHIDLNFGCPVPKVTRRGGGSALPWKRVLFGRILAAAVHAAGAVPVTIKMRIGIDDTHQTYLEAGHIAAAEGVAAVALHARTAAQHYSGAADWDAIGELTAALDVPVLGNGDIWEASDALRMMRQTGCAGVVIGRGCQGRPWLFRDLVDAFDGRPQARQPTLREVTAVMRRHATLLVEWVGDEGQGCREFRKHAGWYAKRFVVGGQIRRRLGGISSLAELDGLVDEMDVDQPFPADALGQPRGRTSGQPRRVVLPHGWLDDRDDDVVPAGADIDASGG
ncbi:MAG: tRNA dihydrouridine synthase DusB [Actinobacteria bacterium]|nr:tRNA dihydrouridine synthase DusB [Actinomycetota bacterium]